MTPKHDTPKPASPSELVHEAVADSVRVVNDLSDVCGAISMAASLVVEALSRVEKNLLAIDALVDEPKE